MTKYESWGRLPKTTPASVRPLHWRSELADLELGPAPVLAYGLGRSYGDSCLNDGGTVIATSQLGRLIHFDTHNGIIRAEAGLSLANLLDVIVPKGWFLPVSPGTKFVTLGGASVVTYAALSCCARMVRGGNAPLTKTPNSFVQRLEVWG
jgi:hypothetical protein